VAAVTGYFINHPDIIEDVLVTSHRNFVKGRTLRANRLLLGNGLLTSEGSFWLRQRRLCQPAFLRTRVGAYGDTMVAYAERRAASWQDGELREMSQEMANLSMEIAAKTLFDADVRDEAPGLRRALTVVLEQNTGLRMAYGLPQSVPTPGHLRLRHAVRELDAYIYEIIGRRRASGEDPGDLLSMLLHAQDEDGSRMTDQQLRDEVVTIFWAGHETTALALAWTWYLLSEHPDVEARLLAELQSVLGGRSPQVADLDRLPYTEMVVHESLRLYPPAWGIARIAQQDCEVGGYPVHAGTVVGMSQWVMHRDPRYFDDPDTFNPDRWAGDLAKRLPKYAYFPFGGGPRLCIGGPFAMLEIPLVLATIAQRFRPVLEPGHEVTPWPSLILRAKHGIPMRLCKR
jgi:cytochrome P450